MSRREWRCQACHRAIARLGPDGWAPVGPGEVMTGFQVTGRDGRPVEVPDWLVCRRHGWQAEWPPSAGHGA